MKSTTTKTGSAANATNRPDDAVANFPCPACNSRNLKPAFSRTGQPFSIFWAGSSEIPEADIDISFCIDCGFAFIQSAYTSGSFRETMEVVYESYLLMEQGDKPFPVDRQALGYAMDFLVANGELSERKNVLEIGSNRGDFLYHLKTDNSHLNVVGVEPSKLSFYGVPTVNAFFSSKLFGNRFDLIITRHVLEHIISPRQFLEDVITLLAPEGKLFIEVPNLKNDLASYREPFILEHVNHFTADSIDALLNATGLQMDAVLDTPDHPLCVVCRPQNRPGKRRPEIDIDSLMDAFASRIDAFADSVAKLVGEGYAIAFYGTGNIFLSVYATLGQKLGKDVLAENVFTILDDSPFRTGRRHFGHRVEPFSTLSDYRTRKLVVIPCTMNVSDLASMIDKISLLSEGQWNILVPWVGTVQI